jgi:hypothetical protein
MALAAGRDMTFSIAAGAVLEQFFRVLPGFGRSSALLTLSVKLISALVTADGGIA